jgi:hypothetical protein
VEAAQQGDWKGIEILRETILAAAPRAKPVKPQFEPMVGAVLLALSQIGVIVDDQIIEAIEQSSANFPHCRVH